MGNQKERYSVTCHSPRDCNNHFRPINNNEIEVEDKEKCIICKYCTKISVIK